MLTIFVRTIILYFALIAVMRLMGKRQLGEMQPYELAITLVVSDLACMPMSDPSIPFIYGILPMLALLITHVALTFVGQKSQRFRKLVNGKPIIVISEGNIDVKALGQTGLSVNDLMASLRAQGYFSLDQVEFAILETNGKISVLPAYSSGEVTCGDMNLPEKPVELPYTVIVEGRFMAENLSLLNFAPSKDEIENKLKEIGLEQKDVFILTITQSKIAIVQSYDGQMSSINF